MRGLIRGTAVVGVLVFGTKTIVNSSVTRAKASSQLKIKEIKVWGNKALSDLEIRLAAGVEVGQGLLEVSPDMTAAKLRENPALADAGVRRVLPGTLVISVRERRPLALTLAGEGLMALDEEGAVFPAGRDIFRMALPVLRNLPLEDKGLRVQPGAWQDALGALRESGKVEMDVSEILWERDELVLVTLDGDRVRILPGDQRVLSRVKWVLDQERSQGRGGIELDARAESMVTVRGAGPASLDRTKGGGAGAKIQKQGGGA